MSTSNKPKIKTPGVKRSTLRVNKGVNTILDINLDKPDDDKNRDRILDYLKSVKSFIDLSQSNAPVKRPSNSTEHELKSLNIIDHKITVNKTSKYSLFYEESKLIGVVSGSRLASDYEVSLIEIKKNLYLRIDDHPPSCWYRVVTVDDAVNFLTYYSPDLQSSVKSCSKDTDSVHNKKLVRYDLQRNQNFRHTMIERYMLISRFLTKNIHGDIYPEKFINYAKTQLNSFDMATKYYDGSMEQYDADGDFFALTSYGVYSDASVTVELTPYGVAAQVEYVPTKFFAETISQINKHLRCSIDDDLPLDVVLFLLPFTPVNCEYIISKIKEGSKLTLQTLYMIVYLLCVHPEITTHDNDAKEEISRQGNNKIINTLKTLYNSVSEGDQYDEDELVILKSKIKKQISQEYINTTTCDDTEVDTDAVLKQIFDTVEKSGDMKYIDRKYIKNVLENED